MEAIILAGGQGTRMQKIEHKIPKVMLEINDKPFLYWIIKQLQANKVNKIILRELNILGSEYELKNEIKIKVRSTGKLLRAKVKINSNKADVNILDGESGISPGQACVFYLSDETGDKVLGGGWIDKTYNKNLST